jgi:uncharacterized protein
MNSEILEFAQKLIKKKDKEIDLKDPIMIVYKVSGACNLSCQYCYQKQQFLKKKVSINDIIKFVDFISTQKKGYIYIAFHGGEPMLQDKRIIAIIEELLKRKYAKRIRFSLQTNGTICSARLFDLCKEKHVTIGLSIDGFNRQANKCRLYNHDADEYFGKLKKTISYLNEHEIDFSVITVLNRNNFEQIEEIMDFLVQYKVKTWSCNDLVDNENIEDKQIILTAEEKLIAYKRIVEYLLKINNRVKPYNRIYETNIRQWLSTITDTNNYIYDICGTHPCGLFSHTLSIECDGTVFPCDMMLSKEYRILNVQKFSENEYYDYVTVKEKLDFECSRKCVEHCRSKGICKINCKARRINRNIEEEYCKLYLPLYDYLKTIGNTKGNMELLNPTIVKRNL